MRNISVSTEVFSLIWANHQDGEESENDILLRLLKRNHSTKSSLPQISDCSKSAPPKVKNSNENIRHANWWKVVQVAIENLGRPSTLSEIEREVKALCINHDRRLPEDLGATIRGTLYDNSSDSDRYKHTRDIFYAPHGKNEGIWFLRKQ